MSGRADGVSKEIVTKIVEGKGGSIMPWVCDVRDIGRGHVAAIEVEQPPLSITPHVHIRHHRLQLRPSKIPLGQSEWPSADINTLETTSYS